MELTGTIKKIGEIQTFASGFQKREMVLMTEEQYPQPILIEFLGDKVDLPGNYQVNAEVTIGINLRGREWTNPQGEVKYFNSITGWKIYAKSNEQLTPAGQAKPQDPINEEVEDDLPF